MRPGTRLIQRDVTTDNTVYAVETNGILRPITTANAIALYGSTWASRVTKVNDQNFLSYTVSTSLPTGQYPIGTLLKKTTGADVFYFDGTNYRRIANESAFNANRFNARFIVKTSMNFNAGGSEITGMESALINAAQNGGTITNPTIPTTTSGVVVSLNANTAPATSIVNNQALAELASFNFTAANDGAATIKTLKLKRIGISADANLDHIYLFEGNNKLTDAGTFSNGYVSFSKGSGLIVVPAGQTRTITVKADVNGSVTGGNIGVSINAASDIVSSGAVTTGSFPINGNLMSMTTATGISTVTLTATTATTSAMKAGNTNAIVWASTALVQNKAVDFKHIAFKQIGSINADDLTNYALYVDGSKVSNAVINDNTLNFDFSAVRLNTGNHTIELKADIVKGSSRNFSFSMQEAANAVFTDSNYNINVSATGSAITAAPSFTISTGTLSIAADTTFNATEVVKTATNATLSRFKLKAFGEDVKVNTMTVKLTSVGTTTATESINDFAIYVDGVQVGSSQSVNFAAATGTQTANKTFGTTNLFTIAAGHEAVVEIKGSMNLDSNTDLDSVKADITGLTAQGVVSYATVTSVAANANNTLNIVSGSLAVAKNSAVQDQNVSKNTQKVKIGSYILSAGSAEGVNVTNVRISFTASTTASTDNMSNLYITDNTTPINPSSINDFNVNFNVAKSSSHVIDVYADLGDVSNGQYIKTAATITYRTDVTQTFGTSAETPGQYLTVATASLTSISNVSDSPVANFVLGGSTATAAKYKFVATNGSAFINELTFQVTADNNVDAISQITVEGVTAPVVGGYATLTGLNKEITAGLQGVQVEVKGVYNPVTTSGQGGIETGNDAYITLKSAKYTVNGSQTTQSYSINSNSMRVVSAYPTVLNAKDYGTNPNLVPSNKAEVMRFKVTNTGSNPVNLKTVAFTPYFDYTISGTKSIEIYDANDLNTNLATSTAVYTNSGTAATVGFNNDVTVNGERTFVVYAGNLGTASTTGNYFQMNMTKTGWEWNDSTISTYIDGTYLNEFQGATFKK